jgi:hypothetical protein
VLHQRYSQQIVFEIAIKKMQADRREMPHGKALEVGVLLPIWGATDFIEDYILRIIEPNIQWQFALVPVSIQVAVSVKFDRRENHPRTGCVRASGSSGPEIELKTMRTPEVRHTLPIDA